MDGDSSSADNYRYAVAFSFLAEDESCALRLSDLLHDRLTTFVYSEQQKEVAGRDGEQVFSSVFGKDARLVIVLYRPSWGSTKWTRIEETAIRNRAFEEGYDFVTFMPLETPCEMPRWLPKSQIWIDYPRWGDEGTAAIIENRAQQLGGIVREESVEDRAERLQRAHKFERERETFLVTSNGVDASYREFAILQKEVEELIGRIGEYAPSIRYIVKGISNQFVILGGRLGLSVQWLCQYANNLKDAKLEVGLWDGHPPYPGMYHMTGAPTCRRKMTFRFGLLAPEKPGWIPGSQSNRQFESTALAAFLVRFYMDSDDPTKGGR